MKSPNTFRGSTRLVSFAPASDQRRRRRWRWCVKAKRGQRTFFVSDCDDVWESFLPQIHYQRRRMSIRRNAIFGKLVDIFCRFICCFRYVMRYGWWLMLPTLSYWQHNSHIGFFRSEKLFWFCQLSFAWAVRFLPSFNEKDVPPDSRDFSSPFPFQLAIVTDSPTNAFSTRVCTIWPATVAIASIVRPIVTARTVNAAKRITICVRMIIAFRAIAIKSVHVRSNVMPKVNVNVNLVWLVTSAIVAMSTISISAYTDVNRADVIREVHWTIHRRVIRTLAFVCVKTMWKGIAAKNANRDSSVWIWRINSVVRRASVMDIRQSVRVRVAIRWFRPHRISTNTRNVGRLWTNTIGRRTSNTINSVKVLAPRPKEMNSSISWHPIVSWAINGLRIIVYWNSDCNWSVKLDRIRRRPMLF